METPELTIARIHWLNGQPIPVDLAMKLTEQGYDVDALESIYL